MPHTHTRHGSSGDDLCSTDEVKIFKDEGDREDDKISSENLLVEEKSSLIDLTESEEKSQKVARPDHSPVFNKLDTHSPSFNMGYLVSPYSYANGAANGLPVTMANKIGLPPFFCHNADPLATPPPAHCGIPPYQLDPKAIGLTRPALYPFATGQYPYPMLGSDMSQVASWHTPSVYSASSFRTPYPSSLPINTTLPSDFPFRFSPSLLPSVHATSHHVLNSHSAIVGSSSKQDCGAHQDSTTNNRYPRNLDTKNTSSNQSNDSSKDISNDKKKPHIKKPLNAFMLYMKEMRAKVVAECTLKESAAINQILGRRWHELSREEQSKYYEKARQERQLHMELYPGWSARDNYGYVSKKKKRKKDRSTTDSGGNNMKKCRARFGLDQQNQWCKPCRRKKKCIRYMEAMNGNGGILEDGSGMDDHGSEDDDDDDDDDDVKLNGSCGSGGDAVETENKIDDDAESLDHGSMSSFAQSPSTTTTSLASPLNMINFINPTTPNPAALLINVNAAEQHQQQRSASVSTSSTSAASASSGSGGTTPSTSSTVSPVTTGMPGVNNSILGGGGGTSSTLNLGNRFSHLGMGLSPVFATTTSACTGTGTGTNKLDPFFGNTISLNNLSNSPIPIPIPVMPNIIRNPIGANPRDINNPLSINQLTNHHQPSSSLLKSSFSQHFHQQQQQLINVAHMTTTAAAVNNRNKMAAASSNINEATTTTSMLSISSHHDGKTSSASECHSSHEKTTDHHQQSNASSKNSSGAGATETGAISVS